MIKEKEVIRISNKDYTVISTIKLNKEEYAFVINMENYNEVLFIRNIKEEIVVEVIKEKKKLKELIKLFNFKINNQKLIESC